LFPFATAGFFYGLTAATTRTGFNATAVAANEALVTIRVPTTAAEVNFRHAFFSGTIDEANFTISDQEFRSWLHSNDWTFHEFYTDEDGFHWSIPKPTGSRSDFIIVYPLSFGDEVAEHVNVKNGYEYAEQDAEHLDARFNITYDKDAERAYMWRTTF